MRTRLRVALLGLSVFAAAGCTILGDDLYPAADEDGPQVVETFPADGWIQVPVGIQVRVWFSEEIDPESVNVASLTLYSGEVLERCRYRVSATEEGLGLIEMSPVTRLIGGARYHLLIDERIRDIFGNPLPETQAVEFTTAR